MKRVLVPIDFGPQTDHVLSRLRALPGIAATKVRLLHAVAPDPDFAGYEVDTQAIRDQTASDFREDHQKLEAIAARLTQAGLDVEPLLVQGPAAEVILDHAARFEADLIVLGSHGHGMLFKALLGSTSESVLRGATCPVLIVPRHDR